MLVNVGYVSVLSFGADVARLRETGLQTLIVPVFAVAVIASRTLGGGLPRLGGRRTVVLFAGCEAVGLLVFALASSAAAGMAALIVLSIGQSLAVPGLGLLALTRVPSAQQGAAAGLFFAWFDAGVGLGGPAVGTVASLTSPPDALIAAALAVATAAVLAITTASAPGDDFGSSCALTLGHPPIPQTNRVANARPARKAGATSGTRGTPCQRLSAGELTREAAR
ncbi:MAG: hypothetical protein ACR2ML_12040 [Solirubrobacteraceae bacterium]